jgi:uncharacterized protein
VNHDESTCRLRLTGVRASPQSILRNLATKLHGRDFFKAGKPGCFHDHEKEVQVSLLTVANVVARLELERHPEGGWFRESYRSAEAIAAAALPARYGAERSCSTAIYFLLERGDISALHRIKSDELWHFYSGTQLTVQVITPLGEHQELRLGDGLASEASFQVVVPAGCWFGAEVSGAGDYALVGCTVAPGFDFADFEMAQREELLRQFPEHADVIRRLTR